MSKRNVFVKFGHVTLKGTRKTVFVFMKKARSWLI